MNCPRVRTIELTFLSTTRHLMNAEQTSFFDILFRSIDVSESELMCIIQKMYRCVRPFIRLRLPRPQMEGYAFAFSGEKAANVRNAQLHLGMF